MIYTDYWKNTPDWETWFGNWRWAEIISLKLLNAQLWTFLFFPQSEYGNSKIYPIFPRYTMLKDMIKDIMHDPDYMEVCHEVDNFRKTVTI